MYEKYSYVELLSRIFSVYKREVVNWNEIELFDLFCLEWLQVTADFDMVFDKVYKWTASSIPERNSFIQSIFKVILVSCL